MQTESTLSTSPDVSERPIADSDMKNILRRAWDWMNPMRIWREVRIAEAARKDFAAGLAIGVFIACVPLYGLQTILSLLAARRLSLHPLPILAGSQLSAPPFAPALGVASVVLGHLVVFGKMPHLTNWHAIHWQELSKTAFDSFAGLAASWLVGGAIIGAGLALITYLTAAGVMRLCFRAENSA